MDGNKNNDALREQVSETGEDGKEKQSTKRTG